MSSKMKKIVLLLPFSGSIESSLELKQKHWRRKFFNKYEKFSAIVITSDTKNFSKEFGILHVPSALVKIPYLKHITYIFLGFYNLWKYRKEYCLVRAFEVSSFLAYLTKKLLKKKYIVSIHTRWSKQVEMKNKILGMIAKFIEKRVIRNADIVIPLSPWLEEYAKNIGAKKTILIPNFIDEKIFNNKNRKEEKMIIFAGRLHRIKNVGTLIKAFKIVEESFPDYWLYIIGDGEERKNLENLSKELNIKNIKFLGFIEHERLVEYYKRAKIFVLPSIEEGQPNVLLEACACEVAIIASNIRANRDVLEENALYFQPENYIELAEKIVYLLKNEPVRKNLAKNLYEKSKIYWFKNVKKKEEDIIIKLLKECQIKNE